MRPLLALACLLAFAVPAGAASASPYAGTSATVAVDAAGDLKVEVKGIKGSSGKIVILLYTSSAGFPTKPNKAKRAYMATISGGKATRTISGLTPGTYALSVYHDANGNGELDTNWLGMPKEGVGASNNAEGTMGPPKFKDAKFSLGSGGVPQSIKLNYL